MIGMQLRVPPAQHVEIVGVVADTQRAGDGAPLPMLYLPMPAIVPSTVSLVVRATDIAAARQAVRAAVSATDPSIPVGRMETLDVRINDATGGFRELASIAVSIGIAAGHPDEDKPEATFERADQALYRAKTGGRNRVIADDTPR